MHRPALTIIFSMLTFLMFTGAAILEAQTTWYVDDDNCPGPGTGSSGDPFCAIQDGIDAASPDDTVFVYNGTYYEHVVVDIRIDLIGEHRLYTIIDGSGGGDVVMITADLVSLENFTIQNGLYGIWAEDTTDITLSRNIIRDNITTFSTSPSFSNPATGKITNSERIFSGSGIVLYNSADALITENDLLENNAGVVAIGTPGQISQVYHNNFLDNKSLQAFGGVRHGEWDNGYPSGGNYWSDHLGIDPDRDGISNVRYLIPPKSWNVDYYPFMRPYGWKFKKLLEQLDE